MLVVIQCAASKRPDAGTFKTDTGKSVTFVADPAKAPLSQDYVVAHPDDLAHDGISWRDKLVAYNHSGSNPYQMYKAYELYQHRMYRQLVGQFGVENTFILSAGWGLIRSDFLTPLYDITFSAAVRKSAPHKLRRQRDTYRDFKHLPRTSDMPIYFFGGKDYLPLFCSLTDGARGERIVFYNSARVPNYTGCTFKRFDTPRRTNWHYDCAARFSEAEVSKSRAL